MGSGRRLAGLLVAALGVVAIVSLARQRALTGGQLDGRSAEVAEKPSGPMLRVLVPAYFYPDQKGLDEWNRLIAAARRVPIIAVANVSSGPGAAVDTNYAKIIPTAVKAGVTVIGYVNTAQGTRPIDEVEADIQRWVRFYPPIQGVFLDAQAPEASSVPYYQTIRRLIDRQIPGAVVISNPGTICRQEFFREPVADLTCIFEVTSGFDTFEPPPWATEAIRRRCVALPYKIGPAALMKTYLARAVTMRLGAVYVTDAGGNNPWHRLPMYWDEEVEAVHRLNRHQAP